MGYYNFNKDKFTDSFVEIAKDYNIISFDIFGTLIMRLMDEPEYIFEKIGEKIKNKDIFYNSFTPYEFKQLRIKSQKEAINSKNVDTNLFDREVKLSDIYAKMPFDISCCMNELVNIELETEKEYIFLNKVFYDLIKYFKSLNKKIILVSDMYLNRNQIQDILLYLKIDINKYIDKIYISCEYNKSKRSGRLFKEICNQLRVSSKEIIHIGDNYDSDIIGAKAAGITAYEYKAATYYNLGIEYEKHLYKYLVPELTVLRKISNNIKFDNIEDDFFFQFGATILGPIFTLFAEWVIKYSLVLNIKNIYPLMREGKLLSKMIQHSLKFKKIYDIEVKPIYISRESIFLASCESFSKEIYDEIINRDDFTIQDLFKTLGIETYISKFKEMQYCRFKELSFEIKEEILEYLMSDDIISIINNNIKLKQKNAFKYLKDNFDISQKFITCDIGFVGTIQRCMNEVLQLNGVISNIDHLIIWGVDKTLNTYFEGVNIISFLGNFGENSDIINIIRQYAYVIECLIMGDIGSTLDYKVENGICSPVLDKVALDSEELNKRNLCQKGILSFQENYLQISNQMGNFSINQSNYINKRELSEIFLRVLLVPTYEEAKFIMNLSFEKNYGTFKLRKFCETRDFEILDNIGKCEFLKKAKPIYEVQWPEAIITIKYPMYLLLKKMEISVNNGMYYYILLKLCEKLSNNKVKEVVIYGAGDIGRNLNKELKLFNIKTICFIDKKEALWKELIDNVEVNSLEYVKKFIRPKNFVIASVAFLDEIKKVLLDNFENINIYNIEF